MLIATKKREEDRISLSPLGKNAESILFWAYRRRLMSQSCRSVFMGETGGGNKGSGLESILVLAVVHKTLCWNHLILTIDVLYGEDPESLYELTRFLLASARCGGKKAFEAIEGYQVSRRLSLKSPNRVEEILHGWHHFALDILEKEFQERGWIG